MSKFTRIAGLLLLSALVLTLVGGVLAQDPVVLNTGRQMTASDIPTIDPALAEDVPSVQIITELFPELIRVHEETAALQPGMAEYSASEDQMVYTFSIVPEVPWVRYNADTGAVEQVMGEDGNPRYVTAQDFAYGILRSIDPILAAPYSYVVVPWVQGAAEFNAGAEASAEELAELAAAVGVVALDEYTLQVTATQASVVTPFIFGMWPTAAQPQWVIEDAGDFWIDPENIVTYGPFALKEWVRGDGGSLTLVANPFWPGTESIPQPQIDEVNFRFIDEEPQLTEFEAGSLDVSESPFSAQDRILSDAALSQAYFSGPGTCTYYYGFNVERPPFDDARARRAFSMAIDRSAITENITAAGESPAGFFTLPSLNAAPQAADFPDFAIGSDAEAAVALWNEYLADTGATADSFSPVLFYNETSLNGSIAQAVQQMWSETLGVNVQLQTADFATYLDTRGNYDVFRAAWCFDYPDTHNFLYDAGWHSDLLPDNDTHWSNADYDTLIDSALVASSLEERINLYAQAENILVNEEAAIAPIYHYVTNDLTAPYVNRTHSLISREYYEKWSINR